MSVAEEIRNSRVGPGEVSLFYLAQAGFCLKTSKGTLAGIDLYLSDCCERMFQFKRLIPAVVNPEELALDILAATHAHADHLDPDALAVFAKDTKTFFVGAGDCRDLYEKTGIEKARYATLKAGEELVVKDIHFRAIYADHGELAPEAVGLLMQIGDVTIYHTGDTSLQVEKILASLGDVKIDVMIVPINGAFGNLNAAEACQLAAAVKPRMVVAAHFGMFAEHGGDPAEFLREAKKLARSIQPKVLENGEKIVLKSKQPEK
jgi:L-ascorbate 6-phosphate lactonase